MIGHFPGSQQQLNAADVRLYFDCADLMLDSMVASGQLDPYHRDKVQDTLLTRHRHQHQRHQKRDGKALPMIRSLADIGRKMSARNLSESKGNDSAD